MLAILCTCDSTNRQSFRRPLGRRSRRLLKSRPGGQRLRQSCFTARPSLALYLLIQSDRRRLKVVTFTHGLPVRKVFPRRDCFSCRVVKVVSKNLLDFLQVTRCKWLACLLLLLTKVRRVKCRDRLAGKTKVSVSAFEPVGSQGHAEIDCKSATSACRERGWRLTLRVLTTPPASATKC